MLFEGSLEKQIEADGFAVETAFLDSSVLAGCRVEADRLLGDSPQRGGVRNALLKSPKLRELAMSGPPGIAVRALLGVSARPVKLTVFDKTPRSNWKVPWHQDCTISVQARRDVPGFGPWTVKDGTHHVQAPAEVLARILAIRIHLDDTGMDNGALRVLPGTHRLGRIPDSNIPKLRERIQEYLCPVPAGGAMAMRPLLLHSSSPATSPAHRRVLHYEFSDLCLPAGLEWA